MDNLGLIMIILVTGPVKINNVSAKKLPIFSVFALSELINCLYKHNKISVTTVEFNGRSSKSCGKGIPRSALKILPKL